MAIFQPDDLARWTGGKWTAQPASRLTGFCFDSRKVRPGDVFVALKSDKADGHAFVKSALAAGAGAALVADASAADAAAPLLVVRDTLQAFRDAALAWRRKVAPFVVGVTGSVGKSTVKEWTAALLADFGPTAYTEANFNNDIGLPFSLLSMRDDARFGVFEAGMSHPGDMAPLCRAMAPDAAIITAIAPVHIEFFDSLAGIANEKATLLRALPKDGFAVLDAEGEFFDYLSSQASCRVVGVGMQGCAKADYTAKIISEETCDFEISGPGLAHPAEVSLGRPGRHNVLDALLAAAAAHECGVPWETLIARLGNLPSMKMRWERFEDAGVNWICDAYNASPASMSASVKAFALSVPAPRKAGGPVLQSFSNLRAFAALGDPGVLEMHGSAPRRAFVLGDMFELGENAAEYHRSIAKVLGEIETHESDVLVCVGELARNFAGGAFRGRTFFAHDAADAARILRRELPPGSTALVKASHGMHLENVPLFHKSPLASAIGRAALAKSAAPARAVVFGAGRSGVAAQKLLEAAGAEVCVLDGEAQFPEYDVDLAVVSPGIPDGHPWLEKCAVRKIPVISELELGFWFWRGRILAVTGSKGKSSVVKLCADALAEAGDTAAPCGNYGTPLCEVAMLSPQPHWAVVEASSFQLLHARGFRPDISVLLNLQADHLDRHGTIENYAVAKFGIFSRFCDAGDLAVCEASAYKRAVALGAPGALRLGRGREMELAQRVGEMLVFGKTPAEMPGAEVARGSYFANAVLEPAAVAAAVALAGAGLDGGEIALAFGRFVPLPHRMQVVAEKDGVAYVDNSKATSLAALEASLEMASGPVRLVAGGRVKEDDFCIVKKTLAKYAKKVYLIGECAQRFFEAWHDVVDCEICGTVDAAVAAARREAARGEVVLLAPGCASFDQFKGYAERGDRFAACVRTELQNLAR